ncbi:hypothetical protein AAY473_008887 [Plecturocebus cupreus]
MGGRIPTFPTPAPGTVAATAAAWAHRLMVKPGVEPDRSDLRGRPGVWKAVERKGLWEPGPAQQPSQSDLMLPNFTLFRLWFSSFRLGVALSFRLKCSGMNTARCRLKLLGSSGPLCLASPVACTTGVCRHIESYYVAHAGLQLLGSSNPPALASQSAGITGVNHSTRPRPLILSANNYQKALHPPLPWLQALQL